MSFHHLLKDACAQLGITANALSDGIIEYKLQLRDGSLLTVEKLDGVDALCLSSLVCFMPGGQDLLALYELLLEAQAFGLLTDGASFTASRTNGKIILYRHLDLDGLDGIRLASAIKRFTAVHKVWKDAYDSGRLMSLANTAGNARTVPTAISFA
ncbi:type III secretion system chaperone [Parachitinimonas caeni]|uniref:Type III secretion system chaperone n=1 Tax=Parachitinimonas caeni TaxID=3031301 RepID=A0ABT7DXT6_9NEIS|nr:type III secretion system chaperone [Parachitinimonas caeni]MDK2124877.1 type III secretion system chaperone [Parachitinimonas caeni]